MTHHEPPVRLVHIDEVLGYPREQLKQDMFTGKVARAVRSSTGNTYTEAWSRFTDTEILLSFKENEQLVKSSHLQIFLIQWTPEVENYYQQWKTMFLSPNSEVYSTDTMVNLTGGRSQRHLTE